VSANPRTKPAVARRALVAVAVPTTMAALLCAATLAGTAFASGPTSTILPVPCGTTTGAPATGTPAKPTPTKSATATPTSILPIPPIVVKTTAPPSTAPTPTSPSPTATPTNGGGGFWGWLNGVWQWIFSSSTAVSDHVPQVAAAAPLRDAPIGGATPGRSAPLKIGIKSDPIKRLTAVATCAPTTAAPLHKDEAAPAGNQVAQIPWHLSTPSMTMYGLTFNGVDTVETSNGSLQVLDFTVQKVDIVSMVTYSYPGGPNGQRQYNNAGSGTTTVLNNVRLWTTKMVASVYGLLPVTLTPTSPITTILGVAQGFTIPIPVVFTNVNADNALMSAGGLNVPGFKGYAGS
jgi:hypothetical protein